jgi:hypothetical protein
MKEETRNYEEEIGLQASQRLARDLPASWSTVGESAPFLVTAI